MTRPVYLIGPMGAGKTEVGRLLAKRLDREFIDTDALVERKEKLSVEEIFEQHGEPRFREVEKDVLAEVVEKNSTVVSCGGGAVLLPENVKAMRESGTVIYLEVDPKTAATRVGPGIGRPLLKKVDVESLLRKIIDERRQHYLTAAHHVVPANGSPDEVVDRIMELIES